MYRTLLFSFIQTYIEKNVDIRKMRNYVEVEGRKKNFCHLSTHNL